MMNEKAFVKQMIQAVRNLPERRRRILAHGRYRNSGCDDMFSPLCEVTYFDEKYEERTPAEREIFLKGCALAAEQGHNRGMDPFWKAVGLYRRKGLFEEQMTTKFLSAFYRGLPRRLDVYKGVWRFIDAAKQEGIVVDPVDMVLALLSLQDRDELMKFTETAILGRPVEWD